MAKRFNRGVRRAGELNPIADHAGVMAAIEREIWDIGLDLEREAVDYLDREGINYEGNVRDSVKAMVRRVIFGLRLEFGANARHAVFVHEGTRPHWPPAGPIRSWVIKKLQAPASQVDSLAFLIRRKIAAEGTKAKPFLTHAVQAIEDQIIPRIEKAITRAI